MSAGPAIPIGFPEESELEFKSAEALRRPERIAREVVGMLNANGGTVWVGVREENGIAVEVDPVADAEGAAARLFDYFVNTLEPSPRQEEVAVEVVRDPDGSSVLRVRVAPAVGRKPYAFLRKQERLYCIRVRARNRPMSREELGDAFVSARGIHAEADTQLQHELEETRAEREGVAHRQALWLRIRPVPDIPLRIGAEVKALLQHPRLTGNREKGWNFANPYVEPVPEEEGIAIHWGGQALTLHVADDGDVYLLVALSSLEEPAESSVLHPYALLEHPAAVFRLVQVLYKKYAEREPPQETIVIADIALFNVRGWKLRPRTPGSVAYMVGPPRRYDRMDSLVWADPRQFPVQQVMERPDHCAYQLVQRVYRAFGFLEEDMPEGFEHQSGLLVLPD